MVDTSTLEKYQGRKVLEGSNPSLSARIESQNRKAKPGNFRFKLRKKRNTINSYSKTKMLWIVDCHPTSIRRVGLSSSTEPLTLRVPFPHPTTTSKRKYKTSSSLPIIESQSSLELLRSRLQRAIPTMHTEHWKPHTSSHSTWATHQRSKRSWLQDRFFTEALLGRNSYPTPFHIRSKAIRCVLAMSRLSIMTPMHSSRYEIKTTQSPKIKLSVSN